MIIRFLKAFGQIIFLMISGMIVGAIFPTVGLIIGLPVLVVSFIAIFKPLPDLHLGHRGYNAAMMIFVGMLTSLISYGAHIQAKELAELREADPQAYLAQLEKSDQDKWLKELKELDPSRYEGEKTKIAEEKAARQAAEEAKKQAEKDAERDRRVQEQQAKNAITIAARQRELEAEAVSYEQQLDRELVSIPNVEISKYTQDVTSINTGLVLLGAWALLYEEGASLPLSEDGEAKRQRFRKMVVDKQVQMLPALRDAYGPAMRKELWIADGSARTIGQGYRTVEFVSVAFARNAHIQQIHDEMREILLMLRFTRAQYRWFEQASEYSYYSMEPPNDSDLVAWTSGGRFRVLK